MLKKLSFFIRVFRISPAIAFRKVFDILVSNLQKNRKRLEDMESPTFLFWSAKDNSKENRFSRFKTHNPKLKDSSLSQLRTLINTPKITGTYFQIPETQVLYSQREMIFQTAENILKHKFNLLGSGLIEIYHGCDVKGIEGIKYSNGETFSTWHNRIVNYINPNNQEKCKNIAESINTNYIPIDWQLDFKSGFRWDESEWSFDINYGNVPGADIKIPWELGRMQHLLSLAYAYILAKSNPNPEVKEVEFLTDDSQKYFEEFKNEILDFISMNPPRFGVQWMCSMDVGIRAVNWLVAYDIFKNEGAVFDEEFERIFSESIFEHGLHITQNFEWSSGLRGNHYFTNITSLLFIASYLETNDITNIWLGFALQELINETQEQFLNDGGNFEASLPYHFFVFEMIVISLRIISNLNTNKTSKLINLKYPDSILSKKVLQYEQQKFKVADDGKIILHDTFWQKFVSIVNFTLNTINERGNSFQIGDNDSGRFIKFTPDFFIKSASEKNQNQISSVAIIIGFLNIAIDNEELLKNIEQNSFFEFSIMKSSDNYFIPEQHLEALNTIFDDFTSEDIENNFNQVAFNDFGIYLNKTIKYFTLIRCGAIGQRGKGGHAHNDNLSICLIVENRFFFVDPGTYIYTAFPDIRNLYRSTGMHNTLELDGSEQNYWNTTSKDDLFWMNGNNADARVLEFSNKIFVGEHKGFDKPHKRILSFDGNYIDGVDLCDAYGQKMLNFHLHPDVAIESVDENSITLNNTGIKVILKCENAKIKIEEYFHSPAYGVKQKAMKLILSSNENKINWKIYFE